MKHPGEIQLALFAGGDLPAWNRWRVGRHVSRCAECQNQVQSLRAASDDLHELAAELPRDLNWNKLAQEMTGNIRVGLAAGEAIARFDKPAAAGHAPRLGWHAALVLAGASLVFVAAFWFSLPHQQAEHLIGAFQRIGSERIGNAPQQASFAPEGVVLEASPAGIQVQENGRTLSLMSPLPPHAEGVTISVSTRGSAGVRYVDSDTEQVTTNKVYYAQP